MMPIGKGAKRSTEDIQLSRYACYLIVMNADPNKEIVALGQTYFAVQTRRQELTNQYEALDEEQKRLYLREEMSIHNRQLADTAREAGVETSKDFAVFQDSGYMGLYNGLKAQDIGARKELSDKQHILDHMGSDELVANMFRASQAKQKLQKDQTKGKEAASRTHQEVGQKVRKAIEEIGGTMP